MEKLKTIEVIERKRSTLYKLKEKIDEGRKENGITLVALVITIIVLLILAGVTIGALLGQDQIIGQSKQASEQYEIESVKEQLYLINSYYKAERAQDSTINREWFWDKLVEEKIINSKEDIGIPEKNETNEIYTIVTKNGYEVIITVEQNENIIIGDSSKTNEENNNNLSYRDYVSDGLILHYDGIQNTKEGHNYETTIWEDLSGNGRDGTLNGGEWGEHYLSLNGSSDGVNIGNQLSDLFKADNTIEITVLFNDSSRDIIIGNYSVSNNINYEKYRSKNFRTYFNDGSPDKSSTSNTINIGTFQTITYVMNKEAGRIEIYNDTNKIDSATVESANITKYNANWNSVWVGRDSRTGSTCLEGQIASVRVYNRQLSSEEITKNNQLDKERFVEKKRKWTIQEAKKEINANNIKKYIGDEIDYQTETGGTWRIFYYDTQGLFSPPNSIILKRDEGEPAKMSPKDHYDYEPSDDIIERMKKADPAWAESAYSNSVNSNAERYFAWCCDPTNWTNIYNSNISEFISCTPSLKLYISSLSTVKRGIGEVKWTSDSVCKYNGSGYNVLIGEIPESNNGVFTAKLKYIMFCSPSSYITNYFWACDFSGDRTSGLYAGTGATSYWVCPIVYLK